MNNQKMCHKCGKAKSLDLFSKDKSRKDGLQGQCKACCSENKRRYKSKPENMKKIKEQGKEYRNRKEVREANYKYRKEYKSRDYVKKRMAEQEIERSKKCPEKIKAKKLIRREVLAGRLTRLPCFICGSLHNPQGHHTDYTQPFFVVWLCRNCHQKIHNGGF